eukprot:1130297-Rhodomonas_salina.6
MSGTDLAYAATRRRGAGMVWGLVSWRSRSYLPTRSYAMSGTDLGRTAVAGYGTVWYRRCADADRVRGSAGLSPHTLLRHVRY